MGQNQSSEKTQPSRGGATHTDKEKDRDRKVHRRISVQTLSNARSQPADASATTVAAQGTTTHNIDAAQLEKILQSTSPELSSKASRMDRSTSRRRKEKEKELNTNIPAQPLSPPEPPTPSGIDIPTASAPPSRTRQEELEDNGHFEERTFVPISHHRPPRLPLPIAELPESPNLGPVSKTDSDVPIFEQDDSVLPRRNSMISVTTQDEEDVGEELQPFGAGYSGQTVPFTIEWNQPAEKVFVTGTFAAWDKKYRLRKRYAFPVSSFVSSIQMSRVDRVPYDYEKAHHNRIRVDTFEA